MLLLLFHLLLKSDKMKNSLFNAKLILFTTLTLLFISISCKQEHIDDLTTVNQKNLSNVEVDKYRTEFSQILAKAIANQDVRTLIKEEAIKKFDQDYDILYQMIKDKEISSGLSLHTYLSSFSASQEYFNELSRNLPLLTIFVPKLAAFSATTWDLASQVPLITVVNSNTFAGGNSKLDAYDNKGHKVELDDKISPNVPVVVVKDNERVVAENKNSTINAKVMARTNAFFQTGDYNFFFTSDIYNKQTNEDTRSDNNVTTNDVIVPRPSREDGPFSSLLGDEAYAKAKAASCTNCYHRDYIYYGIFPPEGKETGPVNIDYKEAVTSLQFVDERAFQTLGGFTEGSYEFIVTAVFLLNKAPGTPMPREFFCDPEDLFTFPTEYYRGGSYRTSDIPNGVKQYKMPPLVYITWDMKLYGDKINFSVIEKDTGEEIEKKIETTSSFGTNFKVSSSGKEEKVGVEFGVTSSTAYSQSVTIKSKLDSDDLQVATLQWTDPIIYEIANYNPRLGPKKIYQITTGSVYLTVEPKPVPR